jgi:outer membrane protein assembly factor BamE (lipoprotein component of BamABCDE complex)
MGKHIFKRFLFFITMSILLLSACSNSAGKASTTHKPQKSYISQKQYQELKIGMTKKQAINLVGNPSSKDPNDDAIWNYDVKNGLTKDSYVSLRFDGNDDPMDENHLSSKEETGLFKHSDFTKIHDQQEETFGNSKPSNTQDSKEETPRKSIPSNILTQKEETPGNLTSSNSVNTSVFEYAESVDVSNTIANNKQVSVSVTMNEKTLPGMATQDVVNETYDFLSQDDIKGAKTVIISIKQSDKTIATFTVDKDKFVPNDSKPMSDCVMKASKIDFMTPEVKKFGETMNSW